MKWIKYTLGLAALMISLTPLAQADTIETGIMTMADCGGSNTGCPAAAYTFTIGTTSSTLTIQISNTAVLNSNNDLIGGVDLGFTDTKNVDITGLTTSSNLGGTANWSSSTGSLSNNGCGGNQGAFVCAEFAANPTNGGVLLTQGGVYSWTWNYDAISAADVFSTEDVHIGANYNMKNGFIVSQTGAQLQSVPEPNTLVILGSGLVGLAAVLRRKYFV